MTKTEKIQKIKFLLNVFEDFRFECLEYFKKENIRQDLLNEFNRIANKAKFNVRLAILDKNLDAI